MILNGELYRGTHDGAGEVGFISSITQPFCGTCSRARLSPEGKLFTCLFAGDGRDLRTPLRTGATDAEIRAIIGGDWRLRGDRYSELRGTQQPECGAVHKVEMYRIGG